MSTTQLPISATYVKTGLTVSQMANKVFESTEFIAWDNKPKFFRFCKQAWSKLHTIVVSFIAEAVPRT